MRLGRNSNGFLLLDVIGSVLILISMVAIMMAVSARSKGRALGIQRETAQTSVAGQLELLINLGSTDSNLVAGTPHTNGDYDWDVTDVTPRLKLIAVRAHLKPIVGASTIATVGQSGYRYDDY